MTTFKTSLVWLAGISLLIQVAVAALPFHWFGEDDKMPTLAPMLEQSKPAVVNIATKSHVRVQDNPLLNDPFFRRFFNIPEQQPRHRTKQSLGSGVIFDAKQGLVLTNNHVINKPCCSNFGSNTDDSGLFYCMEFFEILRFKHFNIFYLGQGLCL